MRLVASRSRKFPVPRNPRREILLDAEDKVVADRGAILDIEGQALLLQLGALGSPDRMETGSTSSPDDTVGAEPFLVRTSGRTGGGRNSGPEVGGQGWNELQKGVERAMRLRCAPGRRAKYTEELCAALRSLEEVRWVDSMKRRPANEGGKVRPEGALSSSRDARFCRAEKKRRVVCCVLCVPWCLLFV